MKGDHTVILTESDRTWDLTPKIDALQFGNANPGGYASVTFDLSRDVNAEDFDSFAEVAVYDSATGEQVGGGRMSNPGRGVDIRGIGVWKMAVLGEGLASTQERKLPVVLIDSRLDSWKNGAGTSQNRKWATEKVPDPNRDDEGLVFSMTTLTVGIGAFHNANQYDFAQYPARTIGGFYIIHDEGRTTTNNRLEFQIRPVGGGANVDVVDSNWSTTTRTVDRERGTDWVDTVDTYRSMNLVFVRINSELTITPGDEVMEYILVKEARVLATLKGRDGEDISGTDEPGIYSKGYVLAHEAVIDTIARYCPRLDLMSARIDDSVYEWKSLVFPDGTNTYDLFNVLRTAEPNLTWAVYEKQDNGLYRFEWRDINAIGFSRYEVDESALLDFELTGGEEERLVRFWYTGTTEAGKYQSVEVIGENPYEDLDIIPTDTDSITIDGREGWKWENEAEQLATGQLTASQYRALACRGVIKGKVYDHLKNRWIDASKMESGYYLTFSNIDFGLRLIDDGDFVPVKGFISTTTYSEESGETTVECNSPTVDDQRALAALMGGRRDLQ